MFREKLGKLVFYKMLIINWFLSDFNLVIYQT